MGYDEIGSFTLADIENSRDGTSGTVLLRSFRSYLVSQLLYGNVAERKATIAFK